MYSIGYLRRQVDALQKRFKPVLAILKLRNLARKFCDEFDEADSSEKPPSTEVVCMMFPYRVTQAGFRLGKGRELVNYFMDCHYNRTAPELREVVFTLIPWAKKGPRLRADLWDRPEPA